MSIEVKYFASLGERLGRSADSISAEGVHTVAQVWACASGDAAYPANTLAAVNMEYVGLDHPVSDGDEVAFFPPVTGG